MPVGVSAARSESTSARSAGSPAHSWSSSAERVATGCSRARASTSLTRTQLGIVMPDHTAGAGKEHDVNRGWLSIRAGYIRLELEGLGTRGSALGPRGWGTTNWELRTGNWHLSPNGRKQQCVLWC